jgi:hypothetical protein
MGKTFHVTTFGCQMNVHDSERMQGMLEALGYERAESRDEADLILFNTCSIRESADNRFIAHLGEAKRLKSEDPERVVGVGGCWAQSVKEEVFRRFPFVDLAHRAPVVETDAHALNPDPGAGPLEVSVGLAEALSLHLGDHRLCIARVRGAIRRRCRLALRREDREIALHPGLPMAWNGAVEDVLAGGEVG